MAQATPKCYQVTEACAFRATVLNPDGSVADGPNNSYVTDQLMKIGWSMQIEAGNEVVRRNACGCLIARKKQRDVLKGIDLALDLASLEPALVAILTGAAMIVDDSIIPVPIGFSWPNAFGECDPNAQQPPIAIEFWQKAWNGPGQATDLPWVRHVYPMTFWSNDDGEATDDFNTWSLKSNSQGNPLWDDPYSDWPAGVEVDELGGVFYDSTIPTADCELLTVGS